MNNKKFMSMLEFAVAEASFTIRPDVKKLMLNAYRLESKSRAKKALRWILDNAAVANKDRLAICQDTGFPIVFVEAGKDTKIDNSFMKCLDQAIQRSYKKNSLRPSVVDPLIRNNSSYRGALYHLEFTPNKKGLKVDIFLKGFGSENKSQLKMFNPTATLDEIEEFIIQCINTAGPEGCPPFVVGVGIGGTSDEALLLAKKALLGDISKPNSDKLLNNLEKRLLKKINNLKIGPMGFGGKTTALAVKVKKSPTHIAGLPVGVNISCHALRSATIKIGG